MNFYTDGRNTKSNQLHTDLNDRMPVDDLLALADSGAEHCRRIVQCGTDTFNTPYKEGLTLGAEGTAYINMSSSNYGTIYYVVSGGNEIYLRSKDSGKWSSWARVITDTNIVRGYQSASPIPAESYKDIIVKHGLSAKPTSIVATLRINSGDPITMKNTQIEVASLGSDSITFRIHNANNGPVNADFSWIAMS